MNPSSKTQIDFDYHWFFYRSCCIRIWLILIALLNKLHQFLNMIERNWVDIGLFVGLSVLNYQRLRNGHRFRFWNGILMLFFGIVLFENVTLQNQTVCWILAPNFLCFAGSENLSTKLFCLLLLDTSTSDIFRLKDILLAQHKLQKIEWQKMTFLLPQLLTDWIDAECWCFSQY